jgi:glycosyltransferase involved in cell wall biosynthesis
MRIPIDQNPAEPGISQLPRSGDSAASSVTAAPKRPRLLVIALGDYSNPNVGGIHTWARNIFRALGDDAAYVCTTHDRNVPTGRWVVRTVNAVTHWAFPLYRTADNSKLPFVPGRITEFMALRRSRNRILDLGIRSVLVSMPECLLAIQNWTWESICYRFPGVENPLERSRYRYGHYFAPLFDSMVFSALAKVDVILASADLRAIGELVQRSKGRLMTDRVTMFPTAVDDEVFHHMTRRQAREALRAGSQERILLYCGRLNRVKGWALVLEAFREARTRNVADKLWIAGDGEDRHLLTRTIAGYGLNHCVMTLGRVKPNQLASYYNAADLLVCGSIYEGWSQTMLEALSCGLPIVSTDVSGARDLIEEGNNGFILTGRNAAEFSEAIAAALALPNASEHSMRISAPYQLSRLKERLYAVWNPTQSDERLSKDKHQKAALGVATGYADVAQSRRCSLELRCPPESRANPDASRDRAFQ